MPRSLVCFDISTNHGTDTVASCVWFENGRPRRAEYRKFRIKTVEGTDDFASMREVVGRYFRRRIEEGKSLPDLVVVDGGRGQLSAAQQALAEVPVEPAAGQPGQEGRGDLHPEPARVAAAAATFAGTATAAAGARRGAPLRDHVQSHASHGADGDIATARAARHRAEAAARAALGVWVARRRPRRVGRKPSPPSPGFRSRRPTDCWTRCASRQPDTNRRRHPRRHLTTLPSPNRDNLDPEVFSPAATRSRRTPVSACAPRAASRSSCTSRPPPPSRGQILARWDLWRYAPALPLLDDETPVCLGEGVTPLAGIARAGAPGRRAPTLGEGRRREPDGLVQGARTRRCGHPREGAWRARHWSSRRQETPAPRWPRTASRRVSRSASTRLPRPRARSSTPIRAMGVELVTIDGHIGDAGKRSVGVREGERLLQRRDATRAVPRRGEQDARPSNSPNNSTGSCLTRWCTRPVVARESSGCGRRSAK